MRIFVTGATGFVGSAVVQELISAGHRVIGLTRSDAGAKALSSLGAEVHRGDLEDLDSLRGGAAQSDGVIHTAFNHDFSKFADNCALDKRAIETIGGVLEGSDRPLLVTSGVALLAPGRTATEQTAHPPTTAQYPRTSEASATALAARGIRASTVRLAPSVHGEGDHGFVPGLITVARAKGVSAYVEDGHNRWPALHRLDAARLYRLAIESGAMGANWHGVADEGVPTREIAEVIVKRLNLPVVSVPREEAMGHFGFLGAFFGLDCPASSAWTQDQLGWRPTQTGLIADLDQPHYFEG
ncbi:MAG: SDR family oxidoreductase [Alphaproteobacteria bacterium]|nr:SDR family oxidoreductase [Alphaproteobacteria bacterium]